MNRMNPDDRVTTVTQVATDGVTEILLEQVIAHQAQQEELGPMSCLSSRTEEEQIAYKNNESLYNEWKELLNEGEEGCGERYLEDGVPWWVATFYLQRLHKKKQACDFWKKQK